MRNVIKFMFLTFLILCPTLVVGFNFLGNPPLATDSTSTEPIPESENMVLQTNAEITPTDGKIAGQGLPANVTLISNRTQNQIALNSNSQLNLSVPFPWTITYTNITVTDISIDGIIEDSISSNFLDIRAIA